MHDESERDCMLIQLWRNQVETRLGVYNVETTHQCLHASPPQIVRPFVCAPHFYGCLVCGREHRCYADARHCEPIVDPDDGATVSCQYSGAVLPTVRAATDFVGTYNEQLIAKDNGGITLEKYLAGHSASETQSRRIFRPHKPMLYSNIRVYLPHPTAKEQQQQQPRRQHHREKQHPLVESSVSTGKTPGDEEMSVEEEEAERHGGEQDCAIGEEVWETYDDDDDGDDNECGSLHYLDSAVVSYNNEQYWDTRFDFLTRLSGSDATSDHVEFSETPEAGGGGVQAAPHFDQDMMNDALRTETSRCVSRLIDQLVSLQLGGGGGEHNQSTTELTHFFTPRVEAVVLLLYNSPVMTNLVAAKRVQLTKHAASITTVARTIRHEYVFDESGIASVLTVAQICEALLLQLFADDYCDEDQCNNRIVVWHRSHWLVHLIRCRVVEAFLGECSPAAIGDADNSERRKVAQPSRKKRRIEPTLTGGGYTQCTRKQLKKSVTVIRDCLVHYKGHGLWLRHFILDHGKS